MTKRAKPRYSRKDVLDALQNLIVKGLVVTKQDPNGRTSRCWSQSDRPQRRRRLDTPSGSS